MGLTDINRGPLAHLVVDSDESLIDTPAGALFSRCDFTHGTSYDCRGWDDVFPDRPCRRYRYALTRTWDTSRRPAVFIMLNPSTANAFRLDPTVRRCLGYARRWGAGGLVVLNAFGLRSTNPDGLRNGIGEPVGPDNDAVITAVLDRITPGPVIVAWGSDETIRRTGRDRAVVELLHQRGHQPQCLATTQEGYPRHPLYLRRDLTPIPYEVVACG